MFAILLLIKTSKRLTRILHIIIRTTFQSSNKINIQGGMPKNQDNQKMATKSGYMLKANKIMFACIVYIIEIMVQVF